MLNTTVQMYEYVRFELNKVQATTLDPVEFGILINASQIEWLTINSRTVEKGQEDNDNLRALIPPAVIIPNTGGAAFEQENFVLPVVAPTAGQNQGYFRTLNVGVKLFTAPGVPVPCKNASGWVSCKYLPRDRRYDVQKNPFWRPKALSPYYYTSEGLIRIAAAQGTYAGSLRLEYVRFPRPLDVLNNVDPETPPQVNQQIADIAVRRQLEIIEQPRYRTAIMEHQLKQTNSN